MKPISIVILGLSITSSWGNGHATTYRSLVRELARRDHDILFLERDVPWYAAHRDLPAPPWGRTFLYRDLAELKKCFSAAVRRADLVIVGSYVPQGVEVGKWVTDMASGVTAFYDIDTPVTLAKLRRGDMEYLSIDLVSRYNLYLSFTGGPTLDRLQEEFGSPAARPLYCSVDPEIYRPLEMPARWDLGYLGTFSPDRQPKIEKLMNEPARRWTSGRFVVAGSQFPTESEWPGNVQRIEHLPPAEHPEFYNSQRFTLNVTRADMVRAGWSPSVRLFEAAACATPVISDWWPGLDELFEPQEEILLSRSTEETLAILKDFPEEERAAIGERARRRILQGHTAAARAQQLEQYYMEFGIDGRSIAPDL